jgi:hypothetical protein
LETSRTGSNNTPIQYQIFDTRAQGTTLSGSTTYASLLGGTPYADTLTVNYSGSVLEGGAGADQLKSNVTTSSAYLNSPTLSYAHSPAGVTINLATGTFSGGDAEGDTMTGSFYNIIGSEFDDKLTGTSTTLPNAVYSNVFKGNGGDDILVGNGGNDLAVYNGDAINYRITINPDSSVTVQDIREGSPDGTDTLTGISNLSFSDRMVTVK